jgi:F-type H+-transporting ATPase subunit beta
MPNIGKIAQIIGPVVDVSFAAENAKLPNILDAMYVMKENGQKIVLECQQHLGEDRVRTIAMDSTDGLVRGMDVIDTASPIKMPIGEGIKGRLFNVVGEAIDGMENLSTEGVVQSIINPLVSKIYLPKPKFYLQVLK